MKLPNLTIHLTSSFLIGHMEIRYSLLSYVLLVVLVSKSTGSSKITRQVVFQFNLALCNLCNKLELLPCVAIDPL